MRRSARSRSGSGRMRRARRAPRSAIPWAGSSGNTDLIYCQGNIGTDPFGPATGATWTEAVGTGTGNVIVP